MSDTTDLEALARRYLDLWQDQLAAMAADPELAEAMARAFAAAGGSAAAFAAAARRPEGEAPPHAPARAEPAPAHRSATTAAASTEPGSAADQLARRVDELEKRLTALESVVAGASGGTAPRGRRRRS